MASRTLTEVWGCAYCGLLQRDHGNRWDDRHGWHTWAVPATDQRKERYLALRAGRVAAYTRTTHVAVDAGRVPEAGDGGDGA